MVCGWGAERLGGAALMRAAPLREASPLPQARWDHAAYGTACLPVSSSSPARWGATSFRERRVAGCDLATSRYSDQAAQSIPQQEEEVSVPTVNRGLGQRHGCTAAELRCGAAASECAATRGASPFCINSRLQHPERHQGSAHGQVLVVNTPAAPLAPGGLHRPCFHFEGSPLLPACAKQGSAPLLRTQGLARDAAELALGVPGGEEEEGSGLG